MKLRSEVESANYTDEDGDGRDDFAACEAHAGVKINNHPTAQQHYHPGGGQTQLVR